MSTNLVDRKGIEPLPHACKAHVLPLSLTARKLSGELFFPPSLIANEQ